MKVYTANIVSIDSTKMRAYSCQDGLYRLTHYNDGLETTFDPQVDCIYSSLEKAIENIKKSIGEDPEILDYIAFIQEKELDNPLHFKSYVLNILQDKVYEIEDFSEYNHEDLNYKKGDWVLFYMNQKVEVGLISAEAKGLEPYLITYESNFPNDCSPHDHTIEPMIIKTISEKEAEDILPRKYFKNIKLRDSVRK